MVKYLQNLEHPLQQILSLQLINTNEIIIWIILLEKQKTDSFWEGKKNFFRKISYF